MRTIGKWPMLAVLATIGASVCAQSPARHNEAAKIAWRSDLVSSFQTAKKQHKALMITFYTQWCGWCKQLDAHTYTDSTVESYSKHFVMVKVDPEHDAAGASLANQIHIHSFPFTIFIKADGTVVHVIDGYVPANAMLANMKAAFQVASK